MTHGIARVLLFGFGIAVVAGSIAAQSREGSARLEFEIASIKVANPGGLGNQIRPLAGGQTYIAQNMSVKAIFALMYKVPDDQVSGGPSWLDTEGYDIEAKAAKPSNIDELHEMFQNLLADRFKLQFHRETKQLSVYALSVDRSGSRLKVNESEQDFKIPITPAGFGKFKGIRVPMSYFCWFLSAPPPRGLGRPVIDKTGLDKVYDFELHFLPELPPGLRAVDRVSAEDLNGPTIFAALKEQLGLKLESTKGPVEVYVIDHAERPSQN